MINASILPLPPIGFSEDQKYPLSEQELKGKSKSTEKQLKLLFEKRFNRESMDEQLRLLSKNRLSSINMYDDDDDVIYLHVSRVVFDCEGFAHYLMKGQIDKFDEIDTPIISTLDLNRVQHKPFTCYKIWKPLAPWVRETMGFWGSHHYFTYFENGQYISKNGFGPIRIFNTFEEMLKQDAFPSGFITADYKDTNDIGQAIIGESMIGTITM